jgi:hypothetical protein
MKKFVSLFITVILVLALLVPATVFADGPEVPEWATKANLIAGQNTTIGCVYVWNDTVNLYVKYEIAVEGWCLDETHLAVATSLEGIPQADDGNPPPGQFPYMHEDLNCVTSDLYTIPLDEFDVECETNLFIAAHAKVIHVTEDCMSVVSDTTVSVTQGNFVGNAVEAWEPFLADPNPPDPNDSYWDSHLDYTFTGGADWIWESYRIVHPVEGDIVYFEKTFNIPGDPTSGTLHITCDNGYEVYLNGTLVGSAQFGAGWEASNLTETYVNSQGWQSVESYDIFNLLVPGTNVLLIKAANEYMGSLDSQSDGTIRSNPAGLIFKGDACYEHVDQEETAWGDGEDFPGANWFTYFTYTVHCTEDCMSVVSDTTVSVTQGNFVGNAVEAWEPFLADPNPPDPNDSYWDSHLDYTFTGGADWIWESYRIVHPVEGDIVYFEKTFNIPGDPTSGTLHITCDNGYEVYLNGTLVGSAQFGAGWEASNLTETYVNSQGWQSVESYDIFNLLVPGTNVLLIKAANEYMGSLDSQSDGTIRSNPAGLIFEVDVCYYEYGG